MRLPRRAREPRAAAEARAPVPPRVQRPRAGRVRARNLRIREHRARNHRGRRRQERRSQRELGRQTRCRLIHQCRTEHRSRTRLRKPEAAPIRSPRPLPRLRRKSPAPVKVQHLAHRGMDGVRNSSPAQRNRNLRMRRAKVLRSVQGREPRRRKRRRPLTHCPVFLADPLRLSPEARVGWRDRVSVSG